MRSFVTPALALLFLACVSDAPLPEPDRSGVHGEVRLVPREGAPSNGAAAYGDRRLRDVILVDYSRPGFGVVYAPGPPPEGDVELAIAEGALAPRIAPDHAVAGSAGAIWVRNDADQPHVVSAPALGLVRRLAPGERIRLPAAHEGALPIYLLDAPGIRSLIFVAPGPWALTSATGRYALSGLPPGATLIRVWHPRFPPVERELELTAGVSLRQDFELSAQQAEVLDVAP